jgi:TolA-binding protein
MNHRPGRSGIVVAIAAVALGGCAVAPEDDPVQVRLKDLDERVQRVERVLTNQSLLELAKRIDTLQADIRRIRGEVEVLQNSSEGGKNQSRALYGDLEKRLAALETLGGVGSGGMPSAGSAPGVASAAAAGEQPSYDAAFNSLKGADYPKAINGFKTFVAAYPSSPLASNAQYWLGEAYYVTRDYPNAITAFHKVTTDWLGKNGDARITLEQVVQRSPGSEAAQLAAERLKRLPAK